MLRSLIVVALAGVSLNTPAIPPPPRNVETVKVVYGVCPFDALSLGCMSFDDPGTVYVRTRGDLYTLEHELGHVFDARNLDNGERNAIKRRLHKRRMKWCDTKTYWALEYQTMEAAPPCEDFADAYMNCRMRSIPLTASFESSYGWWPGKRAHRRMCALIARAAD